MLEVDAKKTHKIKATCEKVPWWSAFKKKQKTGGYKVQAIDLSQPDTGNHTNMTKKSLPTGPTSYHQSGQLVDPFTNSTVSVTTKMEGSIPRLILLQSPGALEGISFKWMVLWGAKKLKNECSLIQDDSLKLTWNLAKICKHLDSPNDSSLAKMIIEIFNPPRMRSACHTHPGWGGSPHPNQSFFPTSHHVSHEKNPLTFQWNTGCLIGILIMAHYNPQIYNWVGV